MRILKILLLCFTANVTFAQASQDFLYEDYTYVPHIQSVELKAPGEQFMQIPIIDLNGGRLYISFDDLTNEQVLYTYRVIHCDKDWNPSNMNAQEYLDGFDYDEFDPGQFSRNTYQDYLHYKLTIPNSRYKWNVSGNYLLVVYEGDENNGLPVITRRFMVSENAVNIFPEQQQTLLAGKVKTHHEFDLKVNVENYSVSNPMLEIYTRVIQNGRWASATEALLPDFVSGNTLVYQLNGRIVFPGGKEFRSLDIRQLEFARLGVHSVDLNRYGTDVVLKLNEPRNYKLYDFIPDINGSFYISNDDIGNLLNTSVSLTADYANVVFSLKMPKLDDTKKVYVIGGFSSWNPYEELELTYDDEYEIYTGSVLLKQGFYDYQYVVVEKDKVDFDAIEGNAFQTVNNYTFLVYHRAFNAQFDRLVGFRNYLSAE